MPTFDEFLTAFFEHLAQRQFRGSDFLRYLERPAPRRGGDEASVVDNAIVSPLLGLLGYAPGEQVYNRSKSNGRPDFAPEEADYGVCFVVEDKSTAVDLTLDADDPGSHLSQLSGYLRSLGLVEGWLTNGRRLMVWRFDDPGRPSLTLDLDIPAALAEWVDGGMEAVSAPRRRDFRTLWDQFRKERFADWQRLEREIATDLEEWRRKARPVGKSNEDLGACEEELKGNREMLVGAVETLLQDLQADARGQLDGHLDCYADYERKRDHLGDDASDTAAERLEQQRERVMELLRRIGPYVGLSPGEIEEMHGHLRELARTPRAFLNTKDLVGKALEYINAARARKFAGDRSAARPMPRLNGEFAELGEALENYGDTAFAWHQRQAALRQTHREAIEVHDNYTLWTSLVQETMLGGLDENQRKDEFALQAAYVVFIRLLLLRVCEDKGIFPNRFISDGGLRDWQRNIERYFVFATGNPYDTLLNMAYQNAQNIYAHFFAERELFNWYSLDRRRFIRVLAQLSRFNFADVDSDLIGTIYSTYVHREEKKQKGQYYTPPEIVRYILDEVGYESGPGIIGPNRRLMDPACGSGTFLVEAARRLVAAYKQSGADNPRQLLDRVRENIYGFDLNPFACYLAEVNLLIQALDLVRPAIEAGNPPRLQRFHVYNVDSLAPASGILYYARANTLMAEELDIVDRIKDRRQEYTSGFAWVVANPPYGAKLTDTYKGALREWWPSVFYGVPDTYVFFFALGLRLLGADGRLGFITPNTYLMGTNTANLRGQLLASGRIEQIVDLPQGIWADVNVDCALLFLAADADAARRRAQQTQVYSMDVRDRLDRLTAREWRETLTQLQSVWMDDPRHEINIRWTPLLAQIEKACRVAVNGGPASRVQRLGDVAESNRGIEPYHSSEQGRSGIFVKDQSALTPDERHWKPLLDSSSHIGRYQLRWGKTHPHLNYGPWLYRAYDPVFYDSPKILFIRLRNRALHRRLVATYDDTGFYNRHNFSNVISSDPAYDLKYILALFNSSLLNYWYARQYPDVEVSIVDTRQLPIYPADAATQTGLVALADEMLEQHAALNRLREQDYVIRTRREGTREIEVPYDVLLAQAQQTDPGFPVLTLFDAQARGLFGIPAECDRDAQISRVFTPSRYPDRVVLRFNQLWLEVPDPDVRRYLLNYLARPQWEGRSWDEISDRAVLPEPPHALTAIFAEEAHIVAAINIRLDAIAETDRVIDNRVLDLYGITDRADRQRILGSAPVAEDAELEEADATPATDTGEDAIGADDHA